MGPRLRLRKARAVAALLFGDEPEAPTHPYPVAYGPFAAPPYPQIGFPLPGRP